MRNVAFAASMLVVAASLPTAATAAEVDGGAVKKVYAATGEIATQLTTSFASVPLARRDVSVPAGGDTIIATFSAECILAGNPFPTSNWIEVEIRDNGQAIPPTAVGSPLAFCTASGYGSHSVQAIKRLLPGSHNIRVFAKVSNGTGADLAGALDNWALTILQAE